MATANAPSAIEKVTFAQRYDGDRKAASATAKIAITARTLAIENRGILMVWPRRSRVSAPCDRTISSTPVNPTRVPNIVRRGCSLRLPSSRKVVWNSVVMSRPVSDVN